ncbi:MAG: DUF6105 family protein [Rhizobiaceae bacterium]
MRILLAMWVIPMVLFWGWYGLSAYDLSMGTAFLSRDMHDLVFHLYGQVLGIPGSEVPAMVAGACAFDTAIVFAIAAFRWRDAWYPQAKQWASQWLGQGLSANSDERIGDATIGSTVPTHPAE